MTYFYALPYTFHWTTLETDSQLDELLFLSCIILCSYEYCESAISHNGLSERVQKALPFMLLRKTEEILTSQKHQVAIIRACPSM